MTEQADNRFYETTSAVLNKAEASFFLVLEEAVQDEFRILCKIRVADLILPHSRFPENSDVWWEYFTPLALNHVDFIICNRDDFSIICAFELDGPTHQRPDRQERDEFVDAAMKSAGIEVIHVKVSDTYNIGEIQKVLRDRALRAGMHGMHKDSASPRPYDYWDSRVLCRDGKCIGVLGPDGHCKVCGKAFGTRRRALFSMQQEDNSQDSYWDNRVLCSDEACIGVVGSDGKCKECGKPYRD